LSSEELTAEAVTLLRFVKFQNVTSVTVSSYFVSSY
jgi:hypothetical protein